MNKVLKLLISGLTLCCLYSGAAWASVSEYLEVIKVYSYVDPNPRVKMATLVMDGQPVIKSSRVSQWDLVGNGRVWFGKEPPKVLEPGYMGDFIFYHLLRKAHTPNHQFEIMVTYAVQNDKSKACTFRIGGITRCTEWSAGGACLNDRKEPLEVKVLKNTGIPCLVSGNDQQGYTLGLGPVRVK